jgi:uncharacterized protein YpuA (DUF1002 family)
MKAKVTLTLPNGFKPLENNRMHLSGENKKSVSELLKALGEVKDECNREANREGFALNDCEMEVEFL